MKSLVTTRPYNIKNGDSLRKKRGLKKAIKKIARAEAKRLTNKEVQ